ncbi:MAG: ABC transporter ATP-binding protein [Gammaproteobacteria bacterium]|jgi:iron(III) transport system ATP-binding protein
MSAPLKVDHISCRYEHESAVNEASFDMAAGDLACLLGPSGCGKTTVLRAIAGFQPLIHGAIYLDGRCISSPAAVVAPEHRNMGMVFQDHALFPHMNVEKNVGAGLFRYSASEARKIVGELLDRVGLSDKNKKYPHELSGGQQQRVALARALAPSPGLLLMDEPFSNLDVDLRERLGQDVRELLKDIGTTCVLVTHDQQDAFTFGDTVGVMRDGRIEQWDHPYNLYHEPQSEFVANFVGDGVFLDGTIESNNQVRTELGIHSGDLVTGLPIGTRVDLLVRPDDVIHDDHSRQSARILKRSFRGESYLYTLVLPSGSKVLSLVPSHHNHAIGENLGIKMEIDHLVVFPKDSPTCPVD